MVETINKVKKTNSQLLHKNGRDPTAEEIADELQMPVEKVREILRVAQEPVSLETPIGERKTATSETSFLMTTLWHRRTGCVHAAFKEQLR